MTGEVVVSLVYHLPEILIGDELMIVSHRMERFFAVLLPDCELHSWFAESELQPLYPIPYRHLDTGDCAVVINTFGHDQRIQNGMIVKIAKVISDVPLYDVRLKNGAYHRWLADFELSTLVDYNCGVNY